MKSRVTRVMRRCQGCEFETVMKEESGEKYAACIQQTKKGVFVARIRFCPIGKKLE